MEHLPWVGSQYALDGFQGQKIAVVGYSHYEDGPDYPGLTQEIVERIRSGTNYSFFTSIRNAFGSADSSDFWDRVVFFNFIPQKIGTAAAKYAVAGEALHAEARGRVLRILHEHKPEKLVAFSSKGWDEFPPYPNEDTPLDSAPAVRSRGTYIDPDGHAVAAFGLRHPQGANGHEMRNAVAAILSVSTLSAKPHG